MFLRYSNFVALMRQLFYSVFVLSIFYPSVKRNFYTQGTLNIIANNLRSASCNIDILKLKIGIGTEVQFCDAFTEIGQQKKSIGHVSPLKLAFAITLLRSELTGFDEKKALKNMHQNWTEQRASVQTGNIWDFCWNALVNMCVNMVSMWLHIANILHNHH